MKKTMSVEVFRHEPTGSGPCVKQVVTATVVALDGSRFIGTNHCMRPQSVCPRAGMETGVGCELCKEVCEQDAHAEVNAIRLAGERSHGATLYLEGHAYACDSCKTAAFFARIAAINVGAPPPIEPDSGAGVAA